MIGEISPNLCRIVFVGLLLVSPAAAQSAVDQGCRIDRQESHLNFTARMIFNLPITGRIQDFDGQLILDDKNPEKSHATITINTASVDTMNPDSDNFIRSKPMLNSAAFPTATLVTKAFNPQSQTALKVSGDLTIKNIKKPLVIPFTYRHGPDKDPDKERVVADSSIKFSRFDYGIGVDSWSNTTLFQEAIQIDVHLEMICPKPAAT